MKTEKIIIANLKCGGCEKSITNKLLGIDGVNAVSVKREDDSVTVEYENSISRQSIVEKLHTLGYPEATEENGLLLQLKSYASCMVGRMSN